MIYRYRTTLMHRAPGIHEHRLPEGSHDPEYLSVVKKYFCTPTGGGKSLGQNCLRPQPQSFNAGGKIQGGGMRYHIAMKR